MRPCIGNIKVLRRQEHSRRYDLSASVAFPAKHHCVAEAPLTVVVPAMKQQVHRSRNETLGKMMKDRRRFH